MFYLATQCLVKCGLAKCTIFNFSYCKAIVPFLPHSCNSIVIVRNTLCLYLCLQKIFYTVDHQILLAKIESLCDSWSVFTTYKLP